MVLAVTASDSHQPEPVHDLDVARLGLVVGVDLLALEGGDLRRRVGAVVDELHPVEVDRAEALDRIAPPGSVGAFLVGRAHADLRRLHLPGAGANGLTVRSALETAVHDQRRIVCESGNNGDVGPRQNELYRVVVNLLDRALAGAEDLAGLLLLDDGTVFLGHVAHELLFALLLDDRRHAGRHRVVGHVLLAPAGEVEHHVIGDEVVAVVPFDARRSFSVYSVASSLTSQLSSSHGTKVKSVV